MTINLIFKLKKIINIVILYNIKKDFKYNLDYILILITLD